MSAIDNLTQQILAQGTTSKWSGEGFGSAEANAKDMAKILADIGITDISQFGKITSKADAVVQPVYGQGDLVQDSEGQSFYSQTIVGYVDQNGNPVDPNLVTSDIQYSGGENGTAETIYKAPVGTQESFGNKLTGQTVANTYGERQMGNMFGGTYSGKGNTGYGVQFDAQGNPVFYTQGASSSDIGQLAPLLTIASFIPALAPFAQGINALIAAQSGNGLGALAGLAGLGGFTDVANAANFANAAKNNDVLGMIMSGANVAGVDNIGDYSIQDIGQTANTLKAIQSGDSNALLGAVLGYASNGNNQSVDDSVNLDTNVPVDNVTNLNNTQTIETYPETSADLTSVLAGQSDNSSITAPTDTQALLDILGDTSSQIISDAPFVAQPTPQTTQTTQTTPDYSGQSFNSAFSTARSNGDTVFNWNGKPYNTNLAPPDAGTTTQVSTAPTTQTNTTNTTAPPVSDVYPDIRGTAADKANTAQVNTPQTTASNLGPYVGYRNAFGMTPQMGDINQVADPRTLSFTKGVLGDDTSNKGFSAMHPDIQGITNAGDVGTYTGLGAEALPLIGPMARWFKPSLETLGSAAAADESLVSLLGKNTYKAPDNVTPFPRLTADDRQLSLLIQDMLGQPTTNQTAGQAWDQLTGGSPLQAYQTLNANPATRSSMLDYAGSRGYSEVSPFSVSDKTNMFQPAQYIKNTEGTLVTNPTYLLPPKEPVLRAQGGLTSSNNLDELLKIING